MTGCLMPDLVIFHTLETIKKILIKDLNESLVDEDTYLYKLLGVDESGEVLKLNMYNVFKQAKKMLLTPNNMSVNFGYNQEVAQIISLHIILPSEQGKTAIGADEGYLHDVGETEVRDCLTQTFDTTYQIMITSNNSAEVNVTYHLLKSMLLLLIDHIELMGLRNPSFSGNDIVMQDDLTPVPIFHKVLNISFMYEHNVPKRLANDFMRSFSAVGKMLDYSNQL